MIISLDIFTEKFFHYEQIQFFLKYFLSQFHKSFAEYTLPIDCRVDTVSNHLSHKLLRIPHQQAVVVVVVVEGCVDGGVGPFRKLVHSQQGSSISVCGHQTCNYCNNFYTKSCQHHVVVFHSSSLK